jgi:hypothetical protein
MMRLGACAAISGGTWVPSLAASVTDPFEARAAAREVRRESSSSTTRMEGGGAWAFMVGDLLFVSVNGQRRRASERFEMT